MYEIIADGKDLQEKQACCILHTMYFFAVTSTRCTAGHRVQPVFCRLCGLCGCTQCTAGPMMCMIAVHVSFLAPSSAGIDPIPLGSSRHFLGIYLPQRPTNPPRIYAGLCKRPTRSVSSPPLVKVLRSILPRENTPRTKHLTSPPTSSIHAPAPGLRRQYPRRRSARAIALPSCWETVQQPSQRETGRHPSHSGVAERNACMHRILPRKGIA